MSIFDVMLKLKEIIDSDTEGKNSVPCLMPGSK